MLLRSIKEFAMAGLSSILTDTDIGNDYLIPSGIGTYSRRIH